MGTIMFQWKDFKTVGDELMANSQGAYIRCATSRYYYSIFGSTREYLIDIMNKHQFCNGKDIHKRVSDELIKSNDPNEVNLAECLKFLREVRNRADYDRLNECNTFFKNNSDKFVDTTNDAFDSLNVLMNNPPYNF